MEALLLLVPFITNGIMFGVKRLAGLNLFGNSEGQKPWLRAMLVVFALVGVVATNFLNGTPVEPNQISSLVLAFVETGVTSYIAHAVYNSWARRDTSI